MGSFSLRITEHGNQFKVRWTFADAEGILQPPAYLVDAGLLKQAVDNVRQQLRVIAKATGPFEKPAFAELLSDLAYYGGSLFSRLMDPAGQPDVVQRFSDAASDPNQTRHDFKIVLETSELFVPWGFVFSGDAAAVPGKDQLEMSLADMKGFWVSHFNISVTYGGTATLPQQRKTSVRKLFALHEGMWPNAVELLKKEDAACHGRLEQLIDGEMEPAMDWTTFRSAWNLVGNKHDSVLYFFGHSDGQRIELREREGEELDPPPRPKYDLSASEFSAFKKPEPGDSAAIFLFNGCRTASPGENATEKVPITANFLKATREKGYFGFIGTEAQVSNLFACRYGTEFMWRLYKEGRSVGETFDELLQRSDLFPQNLLYACYAERKFRFAATPAAVPNGEKQP
jgi:hypothetical protein